MKNKFKEWFSMHLARHPSGMVLCAILLFNVLFFLLSAVVISSLSLDGTNKMGFLEAAFCTITMILDAGCIQFVVADIGTAGVVVSITCLAIIIIGMITFTGAVIGYITNFISNFIDNTNSGSRKLVTSGHTVILNWNTRASEMINDLLYCESKQRVIVLVESGKNEITKEINERIADTIARENEIVYKHSKDMPFFKRAAYKHKNKFRNNVIFVVREGDVFSSKQLRDISLEKAKTVIILGNDINNTICKFEHRERIDEQSKGNSQTIKTLMQVSDITGAEYSADNQRIIVEITDEWTAEIVDKIIAYKQVKGKCNIIPLHVNQVLGQILSQFSLMPELNLVYKELFSNKGATFYSKVLKKAEDDDVNFIKPYLAEHRHAIPLTTMKADDKCYGYYAAGSEKSISKMSAVRSSPYRVKLNEKYWIEQKNVIILGHNSKCQDIMRGFESFRNEWGYKDGRGEIARVVVIDDEESLKKYNWYKEYPFVIKTIAASIYDKEEICAAIDSFVSSNEEDTSILILSDDSALNENIDANALANLVYVQDIIKQKKNERGEDFDPESIDVIVEIIDPKHHDIVNSYSVNNVVISNRYISKMVTQIGEKDALFDFYADILSYDEEQGGEYSSKEIYVKKVSRFFKEVPPKCRADEFIRAVFNESPAQHQPAIVLGYVKPNGIIKLFCGDQSDITVELEEKDKLIVFSNH